jgi:trigger factor
MAEILRSSIGELHDKITVKLTTADYQLKFEKALKSYSKNATVPGFRKGNVPTGVIKKMHGQSIFVDEILKTVEQELGQYLTQEKPEIFAQPLPINNSMMQNLDVNKADTYEFDFEIGLKSSVKIDALESQSYTNYKVDVTSEMVEEELSRMTNRLGEMTEPETVTADETVLNLHFEQVNDANEKVEGGTAKSNSVLVKYFKAAAQTLWMGLKKEAVVYTTIKDAFDGEEKDWILSDLGIKDLASAEDLKFKLTIEKIGLVNKAELNEDLFKKIFPDKEIKTEEELRAALKEDIELQWAAQAANQLHDQIYHSLLDKTPIKFPEAFLKNWLQNNGEKPKTAEEVEAEFPTFIKQLSWTLISEELSKEANIEVKPEELRQHGKRQMLSYMGGMGGAEMQNLDWLDAYVDRMMKDEKFVETTYHQIATQKVFAYAATKVKTVDTPISAKAFIDLSKKHQH